MKSFVKILFILCIVIQFPLLAQYHLSSSVFGNGGVPISGSGNSINGTVGQALIGNTVGAAERQYIGFWNTVNFSVTGVIEEPGSQTANGDNKLWNYPNPFNSTTKIEFVMSVPGYVKLSIYNLIGNEIAVLVNQNLSDGIHSVLFDANDFESGIYFCRLHTESLQKTCKLIFIR